MSLVRSTLSLSTCFSLSAHRYLQHQEGGHLVPSLGGPASIRYAPDLPYPFGSRQTSLITPPNLDAWCRRPLDEDVWMQPHMRAALSRSAMTEIYVLQSREAGKLYDHLGGPVHKIGTTAKGSPQERCTDLNCQRYGSLIRCPGGWREVETFHPWEILPPTLDRLPCPASAVGALPFSIGVRLPDGMSAEDFDRALNARLRGVAIHLWVREPKHWQALIDRGIDPHFALRGTPCGGKRSHMAKEASELFFFRKQHEFAALVAIAEDIVLGAIRRKGSGVRGKPPVLPTASRG